MRKWAVQRPPGKITQRQAGLVIACSSRHWGKANDFAFWSLGAPMNDLRVAFAGHNRPEDLGDLAEVSAGLASALDLVGALTQQAVLLTGLADGADRLAAVAWSKAGLGPILSLIHI